MATPAVDIGTLIVSTPGWCGGRPRIAGTRISVVRVVGLALQGISPAEMVRDYYEHLSLGQVHAALAYYYSNRDEIDAEIAFEARVWAEVEGGRDPAPLFEDRSTG